MNLKSNLFFNSYNFELIDRIYLYDLFVEKIRQNEFLENAIKKFDLIKRNNFQNNDAYEKAVSKLIFSIIIEDKGENEKNFFHTIKFKTVDKKNWQNFLNYLEVTANKEIQQYLNKKFDYFIIDLERLLTYMIEDVEFEISNNQMNDEITIAVLKSIKNRILKSRDIERLNNMFNKTPASNSDNFTAAQIKIKETKYSTISNNDYTIKKVILLSTILGIILGIIFVLILNRQQKRR